MAPRAWTISGKPANVGDVRQVVFRRDRGCLAAQADRGHGCRDQWGGWHGPHDWRKLTIEHVPGVHGPEDTRRNDPDHCVALCFGANVGIPSKELRAFCRSSLLKAHPSCPALDERS